MNEEYTKGSRMIVLENIRSAHNVGAIFRTAEGAGVQEIILAGYTPSPHDRFGRPVAEIAKTALGAESIVPYKMFASGDEAVSYLKKQGVTIVVVEQVETAKSLFDFSPSDNPTAYVFGNEIDGVSDRVCERSDFQVEIPMLGRKESLNVSVSVGVISYFTLLKDFSNDSKN